MPSYETPKYGVALIANISIFSYMSRAEKFALYVGIVGLAANILTIIASALTITDSSGSISFQLIPGTQQIPILDLLKTLSTLLLIYGWFTISWFLVRRYFLSWLKTFKKLQNAHSYRDAEIHIGKFQKRAFTTILSIGILIFPIGILVTGANWILAFALIALNYIALSFLMPIVYLNDMDIDDLFWQGWWI
jgi:hypothetical protein